MHDLSSRVRRPELLDTLEIPGREARRSLLDLRRINRLFSGTRILLDALSAEIERTHLKQFTLLDVASGSCDIPLAVLRWAGDRKLDAQVFALEYRHRNLRLFRDELRSYPRLHPFCADALQSPVRNQSFDFVTCSLFLHHLSDEQAALLLGSMSRWARHAVMVSDLERHPIPYYFFRFLARLFTTTYVSRVDGRTSFQQSFSTRELEQAADRAELAGCTVRRRWPFRLLLVARCQSDAASGVELRPQETKSQI